MDFKSLLFVGCGGALGCMSRFVVNYYVYKWLPHFHFPISTFLVNIIGCFILGYLSAFACAHSNYTFIKPLLMVGFCGGFTTFSTFSQDTFYLIHHGLNFQGLLYVILSVSVGFVMHYLGILSFTK